jgi:SAM-dependent methyltransferase
MTTWYSQENAMSPSDDPGQASAISALRPLEEMRKKRLIHVQNILLQRKTWRFLRYVHSRRAFSMAPDIKSVLVVGAGYGLAELALAIELPHVHFTLTDWGNATHTLDLVKRLIAEFEVTNIDFGQLNILEPDLPTKSFDMVMSVEVLEHIIDDCRAARNIAALARQRIFTLVPYGSPRDNASIEQRRRAYRSHEHFRVGYDATMLGTLFPGSGTTTGCYWSDTGTPFRERLNSMAPEEILENRSELARTARLDIRNRIPEPGEALGIWRLSEPADLGF